MVISIIDSNPSLQVAQYGKTAPPCQANRADMATPRRSYPGQDGLSAAVYCEDRLQRRPGDRLKLSGDR